MYKKIRTYFKREENFSKLFIIFLIVVGSFLRFYNLNWDSGHFFHPDERNIANAVARINFFSQLDPGFFAYGGFTIYLYRIAAELLKFITSDISWTFDWSHINVIGRFFSAFFSILTVIPFYLLSKKLAGERVGLISSSLYTFNVGSIQAAHYGVTESFLTFIIVYISYLVLDNKFKVKNSLAIGFLLGAGAAAKTTAISFLIIPFFLFLSLAINIKKNFLKLLQFPLIIVIGFLAFTLFSPYTFLSWGKFLESMKYETGVTTGSIPVVYTLQFDKTIPYLFQIKNLFWQNGIINIFAIVGFLLITIATLVKRNLKFLIFISFPLLYFLYAGSWHTKFIRYMGPIIPFLLISAAIFLKRIEDRKKLLGGALILSSIFLTILWSFAFFSIYLRPQTRIEASKWIYQNIPSGSKILGEHWDDGLPISTEKFSPSRYNIEALTIYDGEAFGKAEYFGEKLSSADYIVINSRRLYGTLIHLEEKYPITSRYYKLLFDGKLGYQKVAEFTSYPSLLGFEINDDSSEETFQVYEHPKVIILKNTRRLSSQNVRKLLNEN